MPAWVDTPEEEAAFSKAKGIVREQRGKTDSDFDDKDWGLVTHIAKNILKSRVLSASTSGLVYQLAKVEHALEVRAKKKNQDSKLPPASKSLVDALKRVMSFGGQSIAKLRKAKSSGLSDEDVEELADELEAVADKLSSLLEGLS